MYSFISSGNNDYPSSGLGGHSNAHNRRTSNMLDSNSTNLNSTEHLSLANTNANKRQAKTNALNAANAASAAAASASNINTNSFLMELVNASTALSSNTANLLNSTSTNPSQSMATLPHGNMYSHQNTHLPTYTLGANSQTPTSPTSLSCLPKYRFCTPATTTIMCLVGVLNRNLGRTGLRVSQFGLGTWVTFGSQITDEVAEDILTLAYQSGINLFDTAEVYASGKAEAALGRILKKKQWRRSSYIICTKIYWGGKAETERGLSRKHILEGLVASLERLQLDYVDIVFASKPDNHTPMEEIVRAFTHAINNNMAFYWGTSRWNAMEIMEAYSVARQFNLIPPICEQSEYHFFQRDDVELNLPEVYNKIGIGTMTYGSLACGVLSGKYDDGIPLHSRASLKGYGWLKDKVLSDEGRKQQVKVRELQLIADKINCTLAQLSIAWCIKNETIHCILLGASTVDQLYENIQSLQVVPKLTPSVVCEIERIIGTRPVSRQLSKSENITKG